MRPIQTVVRSRLGLRVLRTGSAVLLVVALASSAVGSSLAAGTPHDRTGFMVGMNLGSGKVNIAGHTLDNRPEWSQIGANYVNPVREWGSANAFRFGLGVNDRFVLGMEILGWSESGSGDGYGVVTPTLTFFPGGGGAYVRGGVGIADGNLDPNGSGTGALAALGYELWVSRHFALDPQVSMVYSKVEYLYVKYWNLMVGTNVYF